MVRRNKLVGLNTGGAGGFDVAFQIGIPATEVIIKRIVVMSKKKMLLATDNADDFWIRPLLAKQEGDNTQKLAGTVWETSRVDFLQNCLRFAASC